VVAFLAGEMIAGFFFISILHPRRVSSLLFSPLLALRSFPRSFFPPGAPASFNRDITPAANYQLKQTIFQENSIRYPAIYRTNYLRWMPDVRHLAFVFLPFLFYPSLGFCFVFSLLSLSLSLSVLFSLFSFQFPFFGAAIVSRLIG